MYIGTVNIKASRLRGGIDKRTSHASLKLKIAIISFVDYNLNFESF